MKDLSLVPMEDLVEEIEKRHKAYVLATLRTEEGNKPLVQIWNSPDTFIECCSLCSIADDIIQREHND